MARHRKSDRVTINANNLGPQRVSARKTSAPVKEVPAAAAAKKTKGKGKPRKQPAKSATATATATGAGVKKAAAATPVSNIRDL